MKERRRKEERLARLRRVVEEDPFLTDEELARRFHVSVQTIRLDRIALGLPEMRERARALAEKARVAVRSIGTHEVTGELVHVELGRLGVSVLQTTREMGFSRTGIVRGHHIFAQANSLAVAIVDSETALTGTARLHFLAPVRVGQRIIARAAVKSSRRNKHLIEVASSVDENRVFDGQFVVVALRAPGGEPSRSETGPAEPFEGGTGLAGRD